MNHIQWIVLDVDGVLSDGSLIYTSNGEEIKSFSARDGLGLTAARKSGIKLAIITARVSPMVERRSKELKFDALLMGHENKTEALRFLCNEHNIDASSIAYMGDDLNDLGALSLVGLPMAPQNAAPEVKERAQFISTCDGGYGAVRDAVEYILKAQGKWDSVVQDYAMEAHEHGQ
ncbi:HAD-IIIA family hydrolase [Veillonella caviae]|uniref:KdsC family phosphatase n=1 Tax=Veillonella caviae TaxID=248316 RepID=UPI002A81FCB7|nr:HAD-IIIA family hydrolase [Veillonella caviae]MDY4747006.1 HAD-IIIA family hydrolase [Veillonella caviae]MDY5409756.1 HAD-IIIA family hydrolase [Veillonella caviae]